MKPVLVLKQDGMAVQLGPIQVPLGQRDSNLFYNPGVTSLGPTESFYGPRALDIDHDAERLAQLGVNVDLAMTPERRSGTMRSRQEKYESKMPLQERIARNLSSQVDPTDKAGQEAAFQQALDRTGLGANIGRYASYGLGGLAGLMALQRANESGTDLFSALGSAGTTGYLTQRQLQPALQRLGMRAAGKTLSPPVGENLSSSDLHTSTGATPRTEIADPTPDHSEPFEHGKQSMVAQGGPSDKSSVEQRDWRDELEWDKMYENGQDAQDSTNQNVSNISSLSANDLNNLRDMFGKSNRRSFVGVR